jgi:hypothetical protein
MISAALLAAQRAGCDPAQRRRLMIQRCWQMISAAPPADDPALLADDQRCAAVVCPMTARLNRRRTCPG